MTTLAPSGGFDRKEYAKKRKEAAVTLYFGSRDELEKLQALARSAGAARFNDWLRNMVATGMSGNVYPPGYVAGLEKEIEKLRSWVGQKDEQIREMTEETRSLQLERDDCRIVLARVTGKLHDEHGRPKADGRAST